MNISKFASNQPEKPFHSSGYAQAAHGDQIGSTNSQTFSQRYRIDQNRHAIRKYRDSFVAQNGMRGHISSVRSDTPNVSQQATGGQQPATRQEKNAILPPTRSSFREPPTRYNPYA